MTVIMVMMALAIMMMMMMVIMVVVMMMKTSVTTARVRAVCVRGSVLCLHESAKRDVSEFVSQLGVVRVRESVCVCVCVCGYSSSSVVVVVVVVVIVDVSRVSALELAALALADRRGLTDEATVNLLRHQVRERTRE